MMDEYNDYELVYYAQEYNEDAINILYFKYLPIIEKISRIYYRLSCNKGLELSDIKQECLLAFYDAIHLYHEQEEASFYTFVKTCMENRLISFLRKQSNYKSQILNEAISLDYSMDEYGDDSILNYIEDRELNPERLLLDEQSYQEIYHKIVDKLSFLEEIVLKLRIQNFNYKEIASIIDKDEKSIDNAIQRIKWKVVHMI